MLDDSTTKPDLGSLSPLAREVASALSRLARNVALVVAPSGVILRAAEGPVPLLASCGAWEGLAWVDTVKGESRHKIEQMLQEARTDVPTQPREVNHPTRGGVDIPLLWTALRLGTEGPILAVGRDLRAVSDIQRRFMDAQHETELDYWQRRHAENRYRKIFHASGDAIVVVDAQSLEVLEANERARVLIGSDDRPEGRLLTALLPPPARAPVLHLVAAARHSCMPGEIRVALSETGPGFDLAATPMRIGDRAEVLLRARRVPASRPAEPPQEASAGTAEPREEALTSRVGQAPLDVLMGESARRAERVFLQAALHRCHGLVVPAAALLGLSPEGMLQRLKTLGLESPADPSARSKLN